MNAIKTLVLFPQVILSTRIMSCCLLSLVLLSIPVDAATVLGVSMDRMLHRSALVFEGRVVGVETRQSEKSSMIYTHVTFEILDVIHGSYEEPSIELRFLGGALPEGRGLHVSDMHYPEIGEEGIYFVESLERMQVHPLYGWTQGHLLVRRDQRGVRRVTTHDGRPIAGLKPAADKTVAKLSRGAAEGLVFGAFSDLAEGLEIGVFKQKLREMAP